MKLLLMVLAVWILATSSLWGQLDLLTPREVVSIVEQLPPVAEAGRRPQCPVHTEVSAADPRQPAIVDVEVRSDCGSGRFHERYVVDRRTGVVTTWGDSPSVVGGRASETLATQFVTLAKGRRLSPEERRCLAVEGARGLPGWGGMSASISVEPPAAKGVPESLFWLRRTSSDLKTETAVQFYVDPSTGHVLIGGSLGEVMSAGLEELLAKLVALRSPPVLSDQEALSIAAKVPALAVVLQRDNCSLKVSSMLTPDQVQVAPACDHHYLSGGGVVVNLLSGGVSNPDTGRMIDSPEIALAAKAFLAATGAERQRIEGEVTAKCGGQAPH